MLAIYSIIDQGH